MGSVCFKVEDNKVAPASKEARQVVGKLPLKDHIIVKPRSSQVLSVKKLYLPFKEPTMERHQTSTLRLFSQPKFEPVNPVCNKTQSPKDAPRSPELIPSQTQSLSTESDDSWTESEIASGNKICLREGVPVFKLPISPLVCPKLVSFESLQTASITPVEKHKKIQATTPLAFTKVTQTLVRFNLSDSDSSLGSPTMPVQVPTARQKSQVLRVKKELLRLANLSPNQ